MKKSYGNGFRVCPVCGNSFERTSPNKKFCSKTCNNKFHNNKGVELSAPLTPEQTRAIHEIQQKFIRENLERAANAPQMAQDEVLVPETTPSMDEMENSLQGD